MKSDKLITRSIIKPSIDTNISSNNLNNTETDIELNSSSSSNTDIDCVHNNNENSITTTILSNGLIISSDDKCNENIDSSHHTASKDNSNIVIDDINNNNETSKDIFNITASEANSTDYKLNINTNSKDYNSNHYDIDHDIIGKSSYIQNGPKEYTLHEAFMKTKEIIHPNMDPPEIDTSRRSHYNFIIKKVQNGISNNQGMTIYACGQPGTGKSMIVTKALQYMDEQFPSEVNFRRIFIQGTAVDAKLMYSNIASQLNIIQEISDSSSNYALYIKEKVLKILSTSKSRSKKPIPTTLIFIDEMDMAPIAEIRTLINISNEDNSKLMVIGTGNNVIFPSEINLLTEPYTLLFKEYKKEDLITILKERSFGGIINQNGYTLIATKLLGRQSGKFMFLNV